MYKIWKLTKTRNEKLALVGVFALDLFLGVALTAPFVAAYQAGFSPMGLVGLAAALYFIRRGQKAATMGALRMISERQAQEQAEAILAKLKEIQRQQRGSNVFELPRLGDKKVGGIN